MKILEIYDYDEEMNERFKYLRFCEGEGLEKSHGYSYLHARNMYKKMGQVMGLDKDDLK